MRKAMMVTAAVLAMSLLAVPALAGYKVVSDRFDRGTKEGVVIVQFDSGMYAEIIYKDMDGSNSFTRGDKSETVRYMRREKGLELTKTPFVPSPFGFLPSR